MIAMFLPYTGAVPQPLRIVGATGPLHPLSRAMNFDRLLRTFRERTVYQRLVLAFTVGLFLSCAARVADAEAAGGSAAVGEASTLQAR